jgi:RNA polymerase sigma factor (TIGR02999 family)
VDKVTQTLGAMARGDPKAAADLLPLVYDQLRDLAVGRMAQERPGHTLQPTALVHEAWLRLVRSEDQTWENRAHFFGAAAHAMRRVLIENARRKARLKRGETPQRISLDELDLADTTCHDKVLLIEEALQRLEAEDSEAARVVVMKFFGGMTDREVAASLGVTERTIERRWAYAKACLYEIVRSEL